MHSCNSMNSSSAVTPTMPFQSNLADFGLQEFPSLPLAFVESAQTRPEDLDEDMGVPLEAEEAKVPCSLSRGVRKVLFRQWQ